MGNLNPIGLFDSGVGGISVMQEIRRLLPSEDLVYFADSAYCPYGTRTPEFIRERALRIGDFLASRQAKMIVIASNTTSVAALNEVREHLDIPVVGVEPAIKPATLLTKNGRVGVLATGVTLAGQRFNSLLERFANGLEVYNQPCPGLVEQVESGQLDSPETRRLLSGFLDNLISHDVDVIVLGCTHYPFLRPLIEKIVDPEIQIIDTGAAVAQQVARILEARKIFSTSGLPGSEEFFTSGDASAIEPIVRLLWGNAPIRVTHAAI